MESGLSDRRGQNGVGLVDLNDRRTVVIVVSVLCNFEINRIRTGGCFCYFFHSIRVFNFAVQEGIAICRIGHIDSNTMSLAIVVRLIPDGYDRHVLCEICVKMGIVFSLIPSTDTMTICIGILGPRAVFSVEIASKGIPLFRHGRSKIKI